MDYNINQSLFNLTDKHRKIILKYESYDCKTNLTIGFTDQSVNPCKLSIILYISTVSFGIIMVIPCAARGTDSNVYIQPIAPKQDSICYITKHKLVKENWFCMGED